MSAPALTELPVDSVLAELERALGRARNAVLLAPPGAGKTTRVPLALLNAPWLTGRRIVMLEPRRLAARAAAHYMAALCGEAVGQTVGYRVRLDTQVGPGTRIEVVTEGVLTRMLQDDPALEGVGLVIFDEFHERSLQADVGLALCLDAQSGLREDLHILVMSATLEGAPVARLLGDAPVIASEGRRYPVAVYYVPQGPGHRGRHAVLDAVVAVLKRVLAEHEQGVLVFLPGAGEIRAVATRLDQEGLPPQVRVAPLYGDLPQQVQAEAILPAAPGARKVVLATSIAETSLTIEGIGVVIDAGLMRVPRFETRSGMTRLHTVRVSKASAEQRRGRAGRLGPGACYRLWGEAAQAHLAEFNTPEILETDLAALALDLAQWGAPAEQLRWLDPPPEAALAQARALLQALGALTPQGQVTPHGTQMARLGMHPRLAHLALQAKALGVTALGCELAALLGERDLLRGGGPRPTDIRLRLSALHAPLGDLPIDRRACAEVRRVARYCQQRLGSGGGARGGDAEHVGLLLAFAYPDRIAQRRPGSGNRYRLSNGRGVHFIEPEPVALAPYIVAAQLDGDPRDARVFLAADVTLTDIQAHFAGQIEAVDLVEWDAAEEAVRARRQQRLGQLALSDAPLPAPDPQRVADALIEGLRQIGLERLPWTKALRAWQARVGFLRRLDPQAWPDVTDAALSATLEQWLAPYLHNVTRAAHLPRVDLKAALTGLLDWEQQRALDQLAPTHVTVPSGSRIAIDYGADPPVLAVRVQEMFGAADAPRIAGGRAPLLLHLLSPAGRPVQVTADLAGFWRRAYPEVKKELKGRYPKHAWPDDPLHAAPTARRKRPPS